MSALRLATILIVTSVGAVFAWSVGVPADVLVWGAAAVAGLLVVVTWLTGRHVPPTGIGGQPLQAGDLIPTPSGEWVAYLSPGARAANAAALTAFAAAGAFLVTHHPVPGATALWDQHTSGVFEPVPWLLWVPAVTIWVTVAWVIAGYWLWPHLLDDLMRRWMVRHDPCPVCGVRYTRDVHRHGYTVPVPGWTADPHARGSHTTVCDWCCADHWPSEYVRWDGEQGCLVPGPVLPPRPIGRSWYAALAHPVIPPTAPDTGVTATPDTATSLPDQDAA